MAQKTVAYLKGLWIRAYKPLQQDFVDFFDSFWHKEESIPQAKVTALVQALDDRQLRSEKGQGNGYAGLEANAKVGLSYLPDFAFLIKKADFASLDVIGTERNIYLTENDNKLFYWNGVVYVEMSAGAIPTLQAVLDAGRKMGSLQRIESQDGLSSFRVIDAGFFIDAGNTKQGMSYNGDWYAKLNNTGNQILLQSAQFFAGINFSNYVALTPSDFIALLNSTTSFSINDAVNTIKNIQNTLTQSTTNGTTITRWSNDVVPVEKAKIEITEGFIRNTVNFPLISQTAIQVMSALAYQLNYGNGSLFSLDTLITSITQAKNSFFQHPTTGTTIKHRNDASDSVYKTVLDLVQNYAELRVDTLTNLDYVTLRLDNSGLVYKQYIGGVLVKNVNLLNQALQTFVDDSFTSLAVTGAIGSTGASVSFTTELKNIPYVFVNGLRFKVGVNATPANNICFFGPNASTVRTSLSAILSGDLLFWNPLFANSFDLATTDEIILNYTKV